MKKICIFLLTALVTFRVNAIVVSPPKCVILIKSEVEQLDLEKLLDLGIEGKVKYCVSIDRKVHSYYFLGEIRSTFDGKCIFTEINIDDLSDINRNLLQDDSYFNMISEQSGKGGCPDYLSDSYLYINKVHEKDNKKEIFSVLMALLKKLAGDKSDIDRVLSSVLFWTKLFDSEYKQFKKELYEFNATEDMQINIEYFQAYDSHYIMGIKVKNLWSLELYLDKGVFNIRRVTKAM